MTAPSTSSGRARGSASPNARWHPSTVASKSARACSRRVTATARGIPSTSHSRQSRRVASSTPSAAETTKMAASAARRPARTSPMKSEWPGVSSRLRLTAPLGTEAAVSDRVEVRSPPSRARRPGIRAATSWSNSAVLPAPLAPTRTTLRICVRCGRTRGVADTVHGGHLAPVTTAPQEARERSADDQGGHHRQQAGQHHPPVRRSPRRGAAQVRRYAVANPRESIATASAAAASSERTSMPTSGPTARRAPTGATAPRRRSRAPAGPGRSRTRCHRTCAPAAGPPPGRRPAGPAAAAVGPGGHRARRRRRSWISTAEGTTMMSTRRPR